MGAKKAPSIKAVQKALSVQSNATLWDKARAASPDFASWTSEGTSQKFTEKGFEAMKNNPSQLNSYTKTMLMVVFQMLNAVSARNQFREKGVIEVFDTPNGGYIQRQAVGEMKPISPQYGEYATGKTVDPFIQRVPETTERFFEMNFDYQNLYTVVPYLLKTAYVNDNGIGQWLAGVAASADAAYTVQDFENAKACLNAIINPTNYPLKDTQKINVSIADINNITQDELNKFIEQMQNIAELMDSVSQTGMFNNLEFPRLTRPEDYVLILRAGIKPQMRVKTLAGAFNRDELAIPFEVMTLNDFGGIEHYTDEGLSTKAYPVYSDDRLKIQVGWSATENNTVADATTVYQKDTNANVIGILVERGRIFENSQNPYIVEPIHNPAGLYDNYWISRPNNALVNDPLYNAIVIYNSNNGV